MELNPSLRSLEAAGRPSGTGRPSIPPPRERDPRSTDRVEHRADERLADEAARARRTSDDRRSSDRDPRSNEREARTSARERRSTEHERRANDAGSRERVDDAKPASSPGSSVDRANARPNDARKASGRFERALNENEARPRARGAA